MLTSFKIGAVAAALLASTGSVHAATFIFDQSSTGPNVVSSAGSANNVAVDVNQDGFTDLSLGIRDFGLGGAFVQAVGLPTPAIPDGGYYGGPQPVEFPPVLARSELPLLPVIEGEIEVPSNGVIAPYQEVRLSQNLFEAGDIINAQTFGDPDSLIWLYGRPTASAENILPNVGDTGIFGVRIEIGEALYTNFDGVGTSGFLPGSDITTIFGFIEITHGSIIVGSVGYNTDPRSSITVASAGSAPQPVPLPASALLLMGALGGLGAMRQRQRNKNA